MDVTNIDEVRCSIKGCYIEPLRHPETGEVVCKKRYQDVFENHNGRPQKEGYHLHHINMCKTDDYISNLDELPATDHQLMHGTYNTLCKPLMEQGIIGYKKGEGYYIIERRSDGV